MEKIAVIRTGNKQYKVKPGQTISVEKIDAKLNSKVKFDTLLVSDIEGKNVELGKPSLGEKVEAEVLEHGKGNKVTVVKYKNKTRYKKTTGHRQPFTKVKVTAIA